MIVVMLGPPGVGKGTQAARLARQMGLEHISTGDLFREHLKRGTPLGQEAEAYMDAGELVPDSVVIGMVRDRLDVLSNDLVLDGFPRTVPQADALDEFLSDDPDRSPDSVHAVQLTADEDVLLRRLTGRRVCEAEGHIYHVEFKPPKAPGVCDIDGSPLGQREDDREETVLRRLTVYEAETGPVVAYYRESDRLIVIDGDATPDAVTERIMSTARDESPSSVPAAGQT